jgi:hypothetical protein
MAVLVDVNDSQWQDSCLRAIEYFTRLWGGCGNIIIPTNGKMISPLFWRILERFDPDYLEVYRRTGRDVEIEEPAKFEEAYQRHIAGWEQQIEHKTDPHAADTIRDNLRQSSLTSFEISTDLQQELKERLAPFYFQEWIVEAGSIGAGSVPHHPHTDIADILPHIEHSPRVLRVAGGLPFSPLWWASSFGSVSADFRAQLENIGVQVSELGSDSKDVPLLARLAVKGYEEIESAAFLTNTSSTAIHDILRSQPFRLSMAGLGYYRSIRHRDWMEPVVAVAGVTVDDFALYYALSRMRTRVVWIPPSVTVAALAPPPAKRAIDETWHFVNDLRSFARGNAQRYSGMKIVSVTLPVAQLEQIRTRISEIAIGGVGECQVGTPSEAIPIYPSRYFEANNVSVLRSIAVQDDGVIPLFETPLPKSFKTVDPHKHRWLTEIKISQYHLPRHHVLGERLMGAPSFTSKDVRISSDGPTYFCPSSFLFGGASAELSVPRPTIRIPEPLEIFKDIAQCRGLDCTISDKGFYAENACQKFGGLHALASFLRSKTGQLFASAFIDKTKPKEGDHESGVLLGGRRYFDLDSLTKTLGDENEAARLLDRLSGAGILYRGLVLQCQYCRRADWFALGDLTDSFTCKRCHRGQVFTSAHWRYPSQPHLYYQLDELVYQGLDHNMQVPVLALDCMRRASRDSFLFVHEMAYREHDLDTPPSEVDLNCVVDGLVTIGEAKKDERLGKNDKEESEAIGKYLDLAKRLAAHQVAFATTQNEWHPTTVDRLQRAFADERFGLILLTQKDLYGE